MIAESSRSPSAAHNATSSGPHGEKLWGRSGEKDVALGSDERQARHDHGLDEISVDDQPHLDRVDGEGQDVRKCANCCQ